MAKFREPETTETNTNTKNEPIGQTKECENCTKTIYTTEYCGCTDTETDLQKFLSK